MHLPHRLVVATSFVGYQVSLNRHLPVPVQRRLAEATTASLRPPRGTRVEEVTLGGRPADRVTFGASERPRVIVYLHGGGYVLGSPRMYRALTGHLALAAGAVVYALDYRLAPEHPYPAALDDAVAAVRELVDVHGITAQRIALAGDSAGGGLAVSAALALAATGVHVGALALLSPWVDPSAHDPRPRDFVVSRAWGDQCAARYRGDAPPDDPGYAPMHADLAGLPPTLVHAATGELLEHQIATFAERLGDAGVDVRLVELADFWHSAHVLAGTLRAATDAVTGVGVFLRNRLDRAAAATAH